MVRRKAIAATVVSAFIFSSLMLSNLLILTGVRDQARLVRETDAEARLYDTARLLAGLDALSLLADVQDLLWNGNLWCSTANQTVGSEVARLSVSSLSQGVSVNESISLISEGARTDNMSMLRPFNGSAPDTIAFRVDVSSSGRDDVLPVEYDRTESHTLGLPIRWNSMVGFCLRAVDLVEGRLLASVLDDCSSESIDSILSGMVEDLSRTAQSAGYDFSLAYSIDYSMGCNVRFSCQVLQSATVGPRGTFTVRLAESSSALVRTSAQ